MAYGLWSMAMMYIWVRILSIKIQSYELNPYVVIYFGILSCLEIFPKSFYKHQVF
jgi:hypothetical protein